MTERLRFPKEATLKNDVKRVLGIKGRELTLDEVLEGHLIYGMDKTCKVRKCYAAARAEFERAAKEKRCSPTRKDGTTPIFAHSTRVAAIIAVLGGKDEVIGAGLAHDTPEDCKTPFGVIEQCGGERMAILVKLLTKPKVSEDEDGIRFLFPIDRPEIWTARSEDPQLAREIYEMRLTAQFRNILNTKNPRVTSELKAKAFLGKMIDALDNLVSDEYLDPVKARIRILNLMRQMRHLEVLSPGLHEIFRELLAERGYVMPIIPPRRQFDTKVVEIPPVWTRFNTYILDNLPVPNKHIEMCSDDQTIKDELGRGMRADPVAVNFPHDADDLECRMANLLSDMGVKIEQGQSLLPVGVDGASNVILLSHIGTMNRYNEIVKRLERANF
ncbi:HD domain-containing protein [Candidatus Micrarchaeota archaeon]|nr:HD domain-containing protein [Candidatus Micrarchaeota archaeon]